MEKHKPKMPDIMESIFDIGYLTFDAIAAVLFFVNAGGRNVFLLYGLLVAILCGGDAFHLVPRVVNALKGPSEKVQRQMNRGLQISSITMTVFYVVLYYIWRGLYPEQTVSILFPICIWLSAMARIIICLLPQNRWLEKGGNPTLSKWRNCIFAITGVAVVILFAGSASLYGCQVSLTAVAIIISFACYYPVVFGVHKKPMLGMLMIPKTCAYIWMIIIGLDLMNKMPL